MATAAQIAHIDPYAGLLDSFAVSLEAENVSRHTLRAYRRAAQRFRAWLVETGRPTAPERIAKADCEAFVSYLLSTVSEGTARTYFQALHRWFAWMEEEGELGDRQSPLARMKGPKVHERPPQVLSEEELRALLRVCSGSGFYDRRDMAILRIAIDSGFRRGELVWLAVEDNDHGNRLIRVKGKGGHLHFTPIGARSAQALDRYLRARARHPFADQLRERETVGGQREHIHPLWLTRNGPLSLNGDAIADLLERRAKQAGIERHIHPHVLRHSFADQWKRSQGSEEDLMRIGRWKDRKILQRYGAWAADERAREAHRRLSPGDRL